MATQLNNECRLVGFLPSEISALVLRSVIEEHASEAAFLWKQRDSAVQAPHFKLKHLAKLDARLLAHLCALKVAGDAGWISAQEALGEGDAGGVFVAAYLAFTTQDAKKMNHMLGLCLAEPGFDAALRSALAWLDLAALEPVLSRLAACGTAEYRRIALATHAAHRLVPRVLLSQAVQDAENTLRARALRCIGETRQYDAIVFAREGVRDPDPICQFWAGWSLALLGEPVGARTAFELSNALPPALRAIALEVAMRCGESDWVREVVRSLAADPNMRRASIQAVGAFGDPVTVPWLLDQLEDPVYGRLAGEAFSTITGADLAYLDLTRDLPDDAVGSCPADDELPWPQDGAVREWWKTERCRFQVGWRYLAGEPISAAGAKHVLREGFQRQRHAAAIELARHSHTEMMFPVRARADWQQYRLAA